MVAREIPAGQVAAPFFGLNVVGHGHVIVGILGTSTHPEYLAANPSSTNLTERNRGVG